MKAGHKIGVSGWRSMAGWACAALLVVLLARLGTGLREMRRAHVRGGEAGYDQGVPPAMNAVMMGLGGFRGILAEVLWFRSERLQLQGRYLELTQLADWITRLDPYAVEGWVYNAWNLAYNVSAMMQRPEDRLRWVASGIMLLRDDALKWMPEEPQLYRELAWLYFNKIGSPLDRANVYYKLSLAAAMAPLCAADGTIPETLSPEVRASLLELRLEPKTMRALQVQFGPLDWRMPESHAVYWALKGVACADAEVMLSCRREVYQPLMTACMEQGIFTGDLEQGLWRAAPNAALTDSTEEYIKETYAMFPHEGVWSVYTRFLAHRIRIMAAPRAEIVAKYEQLSALAPKGATAIPLDALLAAKTLPSQLFRPTHD